MGPGPGQADDLEDQSHNAGSRRASLASLTKGYDESPLRDLNEETIALLLGDTELSERRPKHFKGKGRAWKKDESDEDEEYTLAKKKAAKIAKAATKGQSNVQKKRGRPRKSVLSEDIIRDESDSEFGTKFDETSRNTSPAPTKPQAVPRRVKARPRKSALSEEIGCDESGSAITEKLDSHAVPDIVMKDNTTPSPLTPGLQPKIEKSSTPASPNPINSEQKMPRKKSSTPQTTPRLSPQNISKQSVASFSSVNETDSTGNEEVPMPPKLEPSEDSILKNLWNSDVVGRGGGQERGKYYNVISSPSCHANRSQSR